MENKKHYAHILNDLFINKLFIDNVVDLSRTLKLAGLLGNPQNSFKSVHVAGTNGKGSVTYKCAVAFEKAGYKTGFYQSPHLTTFRERIQINRMLISEEDLTEKLNKVLGTAKENDIETTFFQVITMVAFLKFAEEKVDIAVLETGLGGRIDDTNIVTPIISIITAIGLDHCKILGETIDEIALEKAGIIKEGVPVVVGVNLPEHIFEKAAMQKNSELIKVREQKSIFDEKLYFYQHENNKIVSVALDVVNKKYQDFNISESVILEALSHNLPCRYEKVPLQNIAHLNLHKLPIAIVLDVGHNPQAFERLTTALSYDYPDCDIRFVIGFSKQKDVLSVLSELCKKCSHVHFVQSLHPKAMPLENLLTIKEDFLGKNPTEFKLFEEIYTDGDVGKSIRYALEESSKVDKKEVVVICGSFYIMEEARDFLGYLDVKD